jgi:hypothetical protein
MKFQSPAEGDPAFDVNVALVAFNVPYTYILVLELNFTTTLLSTVTVAPEFIVRLPVII